MRPPYRPAPKKSNKVLYWVLGVMGALFLLAIMAVVGVAWYGMNRAKQAGVTRELMEKNPELAAAKMGVAANPDIEVISSDDIAGTMVIRNTKTGQAVTLRFDPARKAMVVVGNQDAENASAPPAVLEDQPWLPTYPGVTVQMLPTTSINGATKGGYVFVTADPPGTARAYLRDWMAAHHYEVSTANMPVGNQMFTVDIANEMDGPHQLMVVAQSAADGTHVKVEFSIRTKTP
jgi:hypothetical protein